MPSTSSSVMAFSKQNHLQFDCRPTRIGVPLATYHRCTDDERGFGPQASNRHPEICAVVGGAKFDSLSKKLSQLFGSIVARGMVDGVLPIGSAVKITFLKPCLIGEGWILKKGKALADAGVGLHTDLFFFELGLDGHPF